MELLRKTLLDLKAEIDDNNPKKALRIIQKHIKDEHHFDSDLHNLTRSIQSYHQALSRMASAFQNNIAARREKSPGAKMGNLSDWSELKEIYQLAHYELRQVNFLLTKLEADKKMLE